jgi:membrane protein YqaA with SNARE-associated domain
MSAFGIKINIAVNGFVKSASGTGFAANLRRCQNPSGGLNRLYRKVLARFWSIASLLSFALVMGGLVGFIVGLMIHDFFSRQIEWSLGFSYVAVIGEIFSMACAGAMVLGSFLGLFVEGSDP